MIIATFVLLALAALYYLSVTKFSYWKVRGIKHDKPIFLFGNNFENFILRKSITDVAVETYRKYPNEKVVGFYRSFKPELLLRDPRIIKKVLTADFKYFYLRGLFEDMTEPLIPNLFFADGDLWKLLRQCMIPAFTSDKLKAMFPLLADHAERLQARARKAAADCKSVDCRELMSHFAINFIGTWCFGNELDSLSNETSKFLELGNKIVKPTVRDIFAGILKEAFPSIFKNFTVIKRVEKEMLSLVNEILEQRNRKSSGRNDFVDFLLECKEKGIITGDSIERTHPDGSPETATLVMDEGLITAQVFVFLLAGYETSASSTSFTLHQIAYNQRVLQKCQEEIDRVLAKYDNKLCYKAIQDMTYMQWTYKEALRMMSPVGFIFRKCARDYYLSDLNLKIDKGTTIIIPTHALHQDPQYFENPNEFYPERFNFVTKNKHVYMPFGEGPRVCIGMRMGMMQSLAGLVAVLAQLSVRPAPNSVRFPPVDPRAGLLQRIKGGLPLIFEERKLISLCFTKSQS